MLIKISFHHYQNIVLFCLLNFVGQCAYAGPNLETVVVQGERSSRLISETTSMVAVVEEEILASGAIEHASQIFATTPGVWVSRGNGQEQLTAIRSPVFTGTGACGAFAMSEDGIALRAAGFCNLNQLFDAHLEMAKSVEVLKGPNSSIVGGNAQFGAINIQLPKADEVESRIQLSGSSAGYRRLGLSHTGDFGSHHLAFLGSAAENDGLQRDSGFSQQKVSLRHSWSGKQWLSADSGLSLMHLEQETAGYIEGYDSYKDPELRRQNPFPNAYRDAESMHAFSRWRYRKLDREWTLTPYVRSNEMDFLMHFVPWQPVEHNAHDSAGWQFQWRRYLPGGELTINQEAERTWAELSEIQTSPAPFGQANYPVGTHYDFSVVADSVAVSAGGFGYLTSSVVIDGAVRLDYIYYDYHNRVSAGSACEVTAPACRFYRPESQTTDFVEPSAHLGLVHQYSVGQFWFAKLASGFRQPQVAELYRAQSAQQADLDSERVYSGEIGLRGERGSWFAQAALFHLRNRDGIIQNANREFINGVDSLHQGLEYEAVYDDGIWFIQLTGQFASHKYQNNPNLLGVSVALKGKQMDTAPQQIHNLLLQRQVNDRHHWSVQGYWLGEHYLDPENQFDYEGHFLVDLGWVWQLSEGVSSSVDLLNVFDRRYADRADVSFGEYRYFPGLERRISLSLKLQL